MTRSKSVSDATILAAARQLFKEKGLSVSTREIAAAAGISEAVLYQRFTSKQQLIHTALAEPALDPLAAFPVEADGSLPEELEHIALAILDGFRRVLPGLLPALGDPAVKLRATLWAPDGQLLGCIIGLTQYLARQAEFGRLQVQDAHATAFLLVSALHSVALFEILQGGQFDCGAQIHAIVQDLWRGLAPSGTSEPPSSKRHAASNKSHHEE